MSSIIEYDPSYVNTTAGKYKISCLVLGAIGLLATGIFKTWTGQYEYFASVAFSVTLILLIVIILKASLRQSTIWLNIEIVICIILAICYVIGSIDVLKVTYHYIFEQKFHLGHVLGSVITSICSVFATLTYFYDAFFKCREGSSSGGTSNV